MCCLLLQLEKNNFSDYEDNDSHAMMDHFQDNNSQENDNKQFFKYMPYVPEEVIENFLLYTMTEKQRMV